MGGLIGINDTWIRAKHMATSWDETLPGIYTTTDGTTDGTRPDMNNIYNYGALTVLRSTYAAIAQLYISQRGEIAVRCSINESEVIWGDWVIFKTK